MLRSDGRSAAASFFATYGLQTGIETTQHAPYAKRGYVHRAEGLSNGISTRRALCWKLLHNMPPHDNKFQLSRAGIKPRHFSSGATA